MTFEAVMGRVKYAAHVIFVSSLFFASAPPSASGADLTLGWDKSANPAVAGYNIYCGAASRNYTNVVQAGTNTTVRLIGLAPGVTYFFAATTYTAGGLESAYSAEASYSVPAPPSNHQPTLDPLPDLTVNQDSGSHSVTLLGISSGAANEIQTLTLSAFSSNPSLIPNPTLSYTSPAATGTLTFKPVTGSFGMAMITVMVDDGGTISNTVIRSFAVTVNSTLAAQTPVTNIAVPPNGQFQMTLRPPAAKNDNWVYMLDPGMPDGAEIVTNKHNVSFSFSPGYDQASTTNLVSVRAIDTTTPSLTTNLVMRIVVLDYVAVYGGRTALQAGQNGAVPFSLDSSDSVTNVAFAISWPASRFSNATFTAATGVSAATLQNQGNSLLITLRMPVGSPLQGSNLVGTLNFQTTTSQSSAFVPLPVQAISGLKPNGMAYTNVVPSAGRVVVVADVPLLESLLSSTGSRNLSLYGRIGTNYQLQYSTNFTRPVAWYPVSTYNQSNVALTITPASNPVISYRLQQK